MSAGAIAAARAALPGVAAWLVGGTVRDALLRRATADVDLVLAGDVEAAARAVARAARAAVFPLGEEFGAWRVTSRREGWQLDLAPLSGGTLEADLARRDFTINAMATPLAGDTAGGSGGGRSAVAGAIVDPFGGREDLTARTLRMVSEQALGDDPLRNLRAGRLALELGLEVEPATAVAVRRHAPGLVGVAAERVWGELRRIVRAPDPAHGIRTLDALGVLGVVLPELAALRGVEQSRYHHLDVFDHTLAVLGEVVALEREPAALGPHADAVAARLAEPLADELSRWHALRLGALLHDAAKPATRRLAPGGRVGFPGHDAAGAELARDVLTRLRTSERLRAHVAALARHHLRLGFLVHERPLPRRTVWEYLRTTQGVTVDVTVLTVADRLATRGRNAEPAIAAHLGLASELLGEALANADRPAPLVRGDELARALDLPPGPAIGRLLAELEAARFAGEVASPEEAIAHARRFAAGHCSRTCDPGH